MVEQAAFNLGRRDRKVVGHRAEHTACAGRSEVEDAEDRAVIGAAQRSGSGSDTCLELRVFGEGPKVNLSRRGAASIYVSFLGASYFCLPV